MDTASWPRSPVHTPDKEKQLLFVSCRGLQSPISMLCKVGFFFFSFFSFFPLFNYLFYCFYFPWPLKWLKVYLNVLFFYLESQQDFQDQYYKLQGQL